MAGVDLDSFAGADNTWVYYQQEDHYLANLTPRQIQVTSRHMQEAGGRPEWEMTQADVDEMKEQAEEEARIAAESAPKRRPRKLVGTSAPSTAPATPTAAGAGESAPRTIKIPKLAAAGPEPPFRRDA